MKFQADQKIKNRLVDISNIERSLFNAIEKEKEEGTSRKMRCEIDDLQMIYSKYLVK